MIEIFTPKVEEKDRVQQIVQTVSRMDDAREEFKRRALTNVMLLYGHHHFDMKMTGGDASKIAYEIEASRNPSSKLKRTSNYILPLFKSLYSRLLRQKASVFAEPSTSSERDRNAARVSKEVAEEFWNNCNRNNIYSANELVGMQAVLMKLILYKLALGAGELEPYFNPKAKSFVYDQQRNDVIEYEVGEAEVRVHMPLNTFWDKYNRWVITRRIISPDQVEYEFGKKVSPTKIDEDAFESRISRILDGCDDDDQDNQGVVVYTKHCLPSAEYPSGHTVSCTENIELFSGDLTKDCKSKLPVYRFKYQDLGFTRNGQAPIEQVADLQHDYNFTLSRISQHKKLMTGKVMAPLNGKIKVAWNDQVGQIIRYAQGFKPTYEGAVSVPEYFYKELERIRRDMEDVMCAHDPSMGRTPTQVKSGVGIQTLSSLDDGQIAPDLIMFEQKLGFYTEHVLEIIQENYNERRLLDISGDDLAFEVKSFIGSDLFGRKRIQIRMGSNFPLDKTERMNYILMLKKEGFISPERAKELLETADIDGAFRSLDESACKQDILNIISGQMEVIAEPFEDHTIFLKVISDFQKGSMYARLQPEIRQRIIAWKSQHQQMLLQEQQAAAGMGAPLPPAAQPQMNGA